MKVMTKCALMAFVCLGQMGRGADALDSWTTSNAGTQNGLWAVAFANGQFVAVGGTRTTGTCATSPDGVAWTQRDSGTVGLGAITWGNGQFVAAGPAGAIATSPDGLTWTRRDAGMSNDLYAVAYGNGHFVAVGGAAMPFGATIVSSSDGVSWAPRVSSTTNSNLPPVFTGIAYGNGLFVAVFPGSQGAVDRSLAISPDGIIWTQYPGGGPSFAGAVAFGNGKFVAVGTYYSAASNFLQSHSVIYSSADGVGWSKRQDLPAPVAQGQLVRVAYGGGQFVAVGDMTYSSPDGTNWVRRDVNVGLSGITYGKGRFVGVAGSTILLSGVIGKLGASLSPGGQFLGTITGVTGQDYAVQRSTNLGDWTALTNVTTNTNGIAQFSDADTTNLSRRFYRALLAQQ
jgi:hypothetical protein